MELVAFEPESVYNQLHVTSSHGYTPTLISSAASRHAHKHAAFLTKALQIFLQHRKITQRIQSIQAQQIGTLSKDTTPLHSTLKLEETLQRVASAPQTLASAGPDPFTELHHLLEKEIELGVCIHRGSFSKEETKLVMEKLKETRKRGMEMINARRKLMGQKESGSLQDFTCSLDPESLVPGEYVVHKSKGIGRFVRLNKEGSEGPEYVILQYTDGMAKLKASQAARLLYRYHQAGDIGKAPALSKLNDPRPWERKKSKSKLAAQMMVVDLLQLYVSRLKQKRQPYAGYGEDMRGFASKFPYAATPDQEQAFADVQKDMVERETPMDRLICGDVGFGKTEIALRAIFRVFLAGKQVMVLAPTTVLARQHYNLICERFADYKARIALLSRFQLYSLRQRREGLLLRLEQEIWTLLWEHMHSLVAIFTTTTWACW